MKTIVIAGAQSGVGKTTLASEIRNLLSGVQVVKIGHGTQSSGKEPALYSHEISPDVLIKRHAAARFLVIESNSILQKMTPDLLIYLSGPAPKPSARVALAKADMASGTFLMEPRLKAMSERLGIGVKMMRKITWLAGARCDPVTAIVLSGGRSSRMGTHKARLPIGDMSIIERLRDTVQPWVDHVIISGVPDKEILLPGVRHISDPEQGRGPLMGLCAGLEASSTMVNIILACDMPEVNVFTLRKQLSFSDDYEMVVPSIFRDTIEPLHGVYAKTAAPIARRLLDEGERRLSALAGRCRTKIVEVKADMVGCNLNTPDEYRAYASRLDKKWGNA